MHCGCPSVLAPHLYLIRGTLPREEPCKTVQLQQWLMVGADRTRRVSQLARAWSLAQSLPESIHRNAHVLSGAAEPQAVGTQLVGSTQINDRRRPTEPSPLRLGVRQSCAHPLLNQ